MIEIKTNIEDVIARLDQLKDEQIPAFARALQLQLALEAETQMKNFIPFKTRQMSRSVTITEVSGGLEVGPHTKYAYWVAFGTDPHIITAKGKEALSWPGANHPVKSVHHPGTSGFPFHMYAARGVRARFPEIADDLIKKMLKTGGS